MHLLKAPDISECKMVRFLIYDVKIGDLICNLEVSHQIT